MKVIGVNFFLKHSVCLWSARPRRRVSIKSATFSDAMALDYSGHKTLLTF